MLILTVLQGPDKGRRYELPGHEPQLIGRTTEALPLQDQTVSRRHAELTPDDGKWYINDLESANGTFINGLRVNKRRLLHPGDQIRTGTTLFVYGQMPDSLLRNRGVRIGKRDEINAHIEAAVHSTDESMIVAVPDADTGAARQLQALYELTQLIGSTDDRQQLLDRVMDIVFETFKPDRGFILLQENPHDRPDPVVIRHRVPPKTVSSAWITVSRTIVRHVMVNSRGVLSSNAMTDKRFSGGDSVKRLGIRSAMCVPIRFKDRLFGVIHIDSQVANYTYTEDQLRLLTTFGVHTGLALSNAQHYAEQLQRERLVAIGQTVASLSHSIKNILQGLRGGADVVELGLRKNNMNVIRSGWEIAARNLDRILGLTMNMLAFSKKGKPELEWIDMPKLLQEIVSLVQRQFDVRKVALLTEFAPDMPEVPVDSSGIHQAVLNLLNNALDAVEPETGAVSLRCDYDQITNAARVSVGDNGVGISAENRKRLFQPFHSTKGLRGTGLGLVVTKKVVDEHRGWISVESTPQEGSTFTLSLPLADKNSLSPTDTASLMAINPSDEAATLSPEGIESGQ